jgi:hypothetical protein
MGPGDGVVGDGRPDARASAVPLGGAAAAGRAGALRRRGQRGGTDHPDAEVYSPPYLFKGLRPAIRSVSSRVGYGQRFFIWTLEAASISRVTLVRLSSVTHSYNQNQRFNDLSATMERSSSGVYVRAPANRNDCPPGHYMLFILNNAGVPSAARIIQVQ